MRLAEKLSHWNTNSKQALVRAKQKWQPQPCGSLEYNGLLMGLKSQTTDCNQNFNWKFFVPSLTYRLLLSHSLMSHFICLYLFLSSPALFHHTQTHSHCFVCPSRPGLLKDLKTMGSISLFIFFITLLVLARQVGPTVTVRVWMMVDPCSFIICCMLLTCDRADSARRSSTSHTWGRRAPLIYLLDESQLW